MHHLRFHSLFPSKPFSPFHNVLKNKKALAIANAFSLFTFYYF
ncbi:hypothetical protein B4079_3949 [Bacillus cereus]|nr:hypothetical protein B4079_3949 [Bacillus cereus]